MNEELYQMIFKRKSFHIFTGKKHIQNVELENIKNKFQTIIPLIKNIKVDMKIVLRNNTSCKRGEYCILLYSEKKDNYLENIGYIGEQLDLWLASKNIGVCWYGMGKTEEDKYNNLDFVIMLAIEKVDEQEFRQDMFKSKRKSIEEIWEGNNYNNIANIVRFAPSACNTQPWFVKSNNDTLSLYRYKKPGKRGLMLIDRVIFYNKIDIGIFMLFIELCLIHNKINFNRELFIDNTDNELTLISKYTLISNTIVTNIITKNIINLVVDNRVLLSNLDKIHTTILGKKRIQNNLKIEVDDVIKYCKDIILDSNSFIYKEGKNWYVRNNNILITINSYNYSIITAHIKRVK